MSKQIDIKILYLILIFFILIFDGYINIFILEYSSKLISNSFVLGLPEKTFRINIFYFKSFNLIKSIIVFGGIIYLTIVTYENQK